MKGILCKSFLVMVALLAAGEIALRLFLPPGFTGSFEYGFNPTAGFEEHPDGTVHLVDCGGRQFHPQTFLRQRPPGVFRVFVLGDSVEYFDTMQSADPPLLTNTYPWLVGADLRQQGINAESFNLGSPGYGSRRCEIVLRQALNYQPNLVVLKICERNEPWEEENFERAEEFKGWHPKNWLRKSFLVQALIVMKENCFLKRLPRKIQTANRIGDNDPSKLVKVAPDVRQLTNYCQTVRETIALARSHHVPVLVITQSLTKSDEAGHLTLIDDHLSDFAEELSGPGVTVLSLKELLTGQTLDRLYIDHMHFKRAGHELIARAVADQIVAQYIKPGPPEASRRAERSAAPL